MQPCHSYSESSLIFAIVAAAKWRYREPSDCFGNVAAAKLGSESITCLGGRSRSRWVTLLETPGMSRSQPRADVRIQPEQGRVWGNTGRLPFTGLSTATRR